MPPVDSELLQLGLLIVSLLAAAIASVALALEFISCKWLASTARVVCAAAWLVVRRVPRKAVWCFILGFSIFAARWLSSAVLAPQRQYTGQPTFEVQNVPVQEMVAVTDRGSRLELYHSRIYGPAIDFSMYALQMEAEQGQVIRLYDASPVCNCHGWVFASGQFGLRDVDVPTILAEHNYVEVRNAEAGDLAVYFDAGRVTHTGLVRMVDVSGLILIESKWGPFGVYLHPPDRQPFDGICRYFRTSRADHRLTIQTVPSAAEDLDDLLARRSCGAERSVAP